MMMLEMVGEDPDSLRQRVPRDVFGQCNLGERIRQEGKVPGATQFNGVWMVPSTFRWKPQRPGPKPKGRR